MVQVYVKYNPYRLKTEIAINGNPVAADSILFKLTEGKRLQEWVADFPQRLRDECGSMEYELTFCGMALDWDDFKDAFEQAEKAGTVRVSGMKFVEGKKDDDIKQKVVQAFTDLREGPVEDFRDARLNKAFESVNDSIFPINVIATMSSGKSTLINALLGNRLMPSKNEACTAIITQILDTDSDHYAAVAYDAEDQIVGESDPLTYAAMDELNSSETVQRVEVQGDIPFLDSRDTALMLVDTPGPNNAQNQAHKNTTYRAINNDSNNLVLYVLNGTQLATNDDASLLDYIAEQIRRGGKQMHDRFLFVINKMDDFKPDEEDVGHAVEKVRQYLNEHHIDDPQLFPCSAITALNIRTHLKGLDIDNLSRAEERRLPSTARDTLTAIDKLNEYDSMHLEQYSSLAPSARQELEVRLREAEETGDTKEQALIHSGICSIEAAVTAYVKKYAKTKKIKDLVEVFYEVLDSNQVLVKAKATVATDAEAAKACVARAAAVREKIADGNAAAQFKARIASLDPMPAIQDKAVNLRLEVETKASRVFRPYGETITSREDAKRLINLFSQTSSDAMAEMTAELESVINAEIVETGNRLLQEYQDKLTKFDEDAGSEQGLDFGTVDLVKGVLNTMRENAEAWTTDDFAAQTVDEVGEVTYEERTYYEKTGQKEERVVSGSHEEKIGTEKVKVGSHKEKVGTRQVRNPAKRWWKIFTPRYIYEDVYESVDDYEDRDVYKTVLDYTTILKDVFEERTERIEKFSVATETIQKGMMAKMRKNLDDGIAEALSFAGQQVDTMKAQFTRSFDALDRMITDKYAELESYAQDEKEKQARLEENQRVLTWLEACKAEIDGILDM